jgi:hypothetical protein
MRHRLAVFLAAAALAAAAPASAEVRLTIADGKVSLSAHDATLSQIMAEWARVGQTRVVNADRVAGGLLNIELTDTPEAQALDILLRNAGAYLLAPRRSASPSGTASVYDRVVIFAVSSAPRSAVPPPVQTVAPPPVFPQPRIVPPRQAEASEDPTGQPGQPGQPAPPVAAPPAPAPPQRPPSFTTFPAAAEAPPTPAQGTTFPGMLTAPAGSRTPGMIVPAPQQSAPSGTDQNRPQ